MTRSMAWASGVASDPGRVRSENQDRAYADDERGIFLVVDGLGGHAAGERAAELAVEAVRDEMDKPDNEPKEQIRRAITTANNRICDEAASNETLRGMACVLTMALISDDKVFVGHVGDSRLYLT